MMKLFKIFGLGTLLWVSVLSFFNEKREVADDGTPKTSITSASRLYFMNVRQTFYDRENRQDAKMNIFRLSKRELTDLQPVINLSIIINRVKDDAYIFVEPSAFIDNEGLEVRYSFNEEVFGSIPFAGGNRYEHYRFVERLYPLLLEDASFEIKVGEDWLPILEEKRERDAFRITAFDYFRLTEREEMNK